MRGLLTMRSGEKSLPLGKSNYLKGKNLCQQVGGSNLQVAGRRSAGCRSLFYQYRKYPKHS